MAYCDNCGRAVSEGSTYCDKCINIILGSAEPAPQMPQPRPAYHHPAGLSDMPGKGGAAMVVNGGILTLIGAFTLFYSWVSSTDGSSSMFMSTSSLPGDFAYMWLIPIGGMLMLIFGILAYFLQHNTMTWIPIIFGAIIMFLPLVFVIHFAGYTHMSIGDVFYSSATFSSPSPYSFSSSYGRIFIGGAVAIFGGFLAFFGGWMMKIKMRIEPRMRYPPHQGY